MGAAILSEAHAIPGTSLGDRLALSVQRAPAAPIALSLCLAWTVLVRSPFLNVAEGDDAFYDAVAFLWRHGHLPYRDAFDVKPPGFFALAVLAQSIFGNGLMALRAVAIVSDAITSASLWRIGQRLKAPEAGLFAALLFPVLSVFSICNAAYSPLLALTTLAFAAALGPGSLARRAGLAGLAIGAACCVKQTAAFEAIALLLVFVAGADARGQRGRIAFVFGLGVAATPLAFLCLFAAQGAAGDLVRATVWDAFTRTRSPLEHLTFAQGVARTPRMLQGLFPLLIGAAFAILHRDRVFDGPFPRALSIAWIGAGLASLVAQRSVAMFYASPLIAPALLLSGLAVTRALPRTPWIRAAASLALAAVAISLAVARPADNLDARVPQAGNTRAAEIIASRNPEPGDRLYVVNHHMWLYSAVGLAPPTPYFSPLITLCELFPDGDARLAEIFDAGPRFVAVGDRRRSPVCERPDRWRLIEAWLDRDYAEIGVAEDDLDGYTIYERKPSRPAR